MVRPRKEQTPIVCDPFVIMWTQVNPVPSPTWNPNHFVPCVPKGNKGTYIAQQLCTTQPTSIHLASQPVHIDDSSQLPVVSSVPAVLNPPSAHNSFPSFQQLLPQPTHDHHKKVTAQDTFQENSESMASPLHMQRSNSTKICSIHNLGIQRSNVSCKEMSNKIQTVIKHKPADNKQQVTICTENNGINAVQAIDCDVICKPQQLPSFCNKNSKPSSRHKVC